MLTQPMKSDDDDDDDLSATSQRPISTKFGQETYFGVPSRNSEKHFRKFLL